MVRIDPLMYRKYVTYSENDVPMLYLRLSKALYGISMAVFLFCRRLYIRLKKLGFEINPYDPCVIKMVVPGGGITVCWYTGDFKTSHRDETIVNEFA